MTAGASRVLHPIKIRRQNSLDYVTEQCYGSGILQSCAVTTVRVPPPENGISRRRGTRACSVWATAKPMRLDVPVPASACRGSGRGAGRRDFGGAAERRSEPNAGKVNEFNRPLVQFCAGKISGASFARNISHAGGAVKQKLQYEGEFLNSYHNIWDDLQSKLLF